MRGPCPTCFPSGARHALRRPHTSYEDGQPVRGTQCQNCGHFEPTKDRTRKAETGSTVWDRAQAMLEPKDEFGRRTWRGYVPLAMLREMLEHHASREPNVSSEVGLLPWPKASMWRWLRDGYNRKREERLVEKTGRAVEARVYLREERKPSGTTYRVYLHGICAFSDDERESYFPW